MISSLDYYKDKILAEKNDSIINLIRSLTDKVKLCLGIHRNLPMELLFENILNEKHIFLLI